MEDLQYFSLSDWCFIFWIICYFITFVKLLKDGEEPESYTIFSFIVMYSWPLIWLGYGIELYSKLERERVMRLKKSAEAGDTAAGFALGKYYFNRIDKLKSPEAKVASAQKSYTWYTQAARQGHQEAMYGLIALKKKGYIFEEAPRPAPKEKETSAILKELEQKAEAGDPRYQCLLGEYLYHGYGIPANPPRAYEWYQKAARQGHPAAEYMMGVLCEEYTSDKDSGMRSAVKWFKKAGRHGSAKARFKLGELYLRGLAVEKDTQKARRCFALAAAQGCKEAQAALASLE